MVYSRMVRGYGGALLSADGPWCSEGAGQAWLHMRHGRAGARVIRAHTGQGGRIGDRQQPVRAMLFRGLGWSWFELGAGGVCACHEGCRRDWLQRVRSCRHAGPSGRVERRGAVGHRRRNTGGEGEKKRCARDASGAMEWVCPQLVCVLGSARLSLGGRRGAAQAGMVHVRSIKRGRKGKAERGAVHESRMLLATG